MFLLYFFVFQIHGIISRNLCVNDTVPISLDINRPVPRFVKMTISFELKSKVFSIRPEDSNHLRIGDVYQCGTLIYPDSEILIYRKVIKSLDTEFGGALVQINSTYQNGDKKFNEIVEFIKTSRLAPFKEVVRRPLTLDLKPGSVKHPLIQMKSRNVIIRSSEIVDYRKEVINFDIGSSDERLNFVIGEIRYGNVVIDPDVINVIHKGVYVYIDHQSELIIQIVKMVKNGNCVTENWIMIFNNRNEDERSCQLMTTYISVMI